MNNNVHFDLFLAQNFQMALEDLKCSTRVIWTTLMMFYDAIMYFLKLESKKVIQV